MHGQKHATVRARSRRHRAATDRQKRPYPCRWAGPRAAARCAGRWGSENALRSELSGEAGSWRPASATEATWSKMPAVSSSADSAGMAAKLSPLSDEVGRVDREWTHREVGVDPVPTTCATAVRHPRHTSNRGAHRAGTNARNKCRTCRAALVNLPAQVQSRHGGPAQGRGLGDELGVPSGPPRPGRVGGGPRCRCRCRVTVSGRFPTDRGRRPQPVGRVRLRTRPQQVNSSKGTAGRPSNRADAACRVRFRNDRQYCSGSWPVSASM